MNTKNRLLLLQILVCAVLTISHLGCGSSSAPPPPAISVTVSPATATLMASGQQAFTPTVINDPADRGVNWTVSCSAGSCGSVSPSSTLSGAATTYTAPSTPPESNLTVTVTATSAADPTKSMSATVTVSAISVSVSPTAANVALNAKQQFTGSVANDPGNGGVTWTLTQNGTACSPACGTVAPANTASGAPTTYTAPASQPSPATVTVTATSVTDTTKSASATLTLTGPITVSVSPTSANVQIGSTVQFTPTVGNDTDNGGVTWALTQNGASCSPGCGTISPASTASGTPTAYTAPPAIPANATVTLTATSVTDPTKAASAAITVVNISVSVAPGSASVPEGGMQPFTATVTGDPSHGGVNWSLVLTYWTHRCASGTCTPPLMHTSLCSPQCGTVSPANTGSGVPVTYTAPAGWMPPASCCGYQTSFTIQATSVTSNAFGSAQLSILPTSVSLSPTSASVALNDTQQFRATVVNDGTNSGVNWTLTQEGAACSPACGTITPTTPSGAAATYTAPADPPLRPSMTLTATSVEDSTKSASASVLLTGADGLVACSAGSGQESLLEGQYAFLLQGFDNADIVATGGSFAADGKGHITGGEEDSLHSYAGASLGDAGITAAGSSYAVGPDHRGCLMLANSTGGSTFFRFALGSINSSSIATKGDVIEFDDTATVPPTRATGTLHLQDANSFSASAFNGAWVFGLAGDSCCSGPAAMAGAITPDGTSTITGGSFDFNSAGTFLSNIAFTPGTPFNCCSTNGRGTIGTPGTVQDNGGAWVPQLTMYMIDSNQAFLVGNVLYNPNNNCCEALVALGLAGGEAFAAPGSFSDGSLNGAMVFRSGAIDTVDIGTESADGSGNLTGTNYQNSSGTFTTTNTAFTYSVGSNGRVTLSGGSSSPPILYLYGANQGLLLGTGSNVTVGVLEPQAAGPFSNALFSGAYMLGNETPASNLQLACYCLNLTFESGVITANGTGNASGTAEQSGPSGLAQNQSLNFTYSIAADGTGNVGSGTTAIIISPNKLAYFANTDPNPTITVVEK